ncbi:hypothetical protein [Rhabdothermincola sediminis]|uniref:hypothetical protein n=1 Tax=Rhabdothermincola sediminis TaxID=2751370 RepID=UPI001AA0958F|nr:hypothetical protein [Rhabdothermincola sediminis]
MSSRPGLVHAAVLALVVALTGCRMQVAVDIAVDDAGSGTVTVGIGLDDDALARVGDLRRQLRVDDLQHTGWEISEPQEEPDGLTWVRARKAFDDPAGATAVLSELTGPDGAFRGFTVGEEAGVLGTTYRVEGTVDLTAGPEAFSDAELAAALGGDPYGGTLAAIEREEGQRVADMVEFRVNVALPNASTKSYVASFDDEHPTSIDASSTVNSKAAVLLVWTLVAAAGLVALVALRRAFGRVRA